MKLATLCSGIGAPEVVARSLGWECIWGAEIERFPSAVLKHHHPEVHNYRDVTRLKGDRLEKPDVLIFGSPCQSFSIAGRRLGLDDPRGNVTLECLRVVGELLSRWVVIENVPGILSDDGGRTLGTILAILGQFGYGFAYHILDAQFFGVPQRRRRVFIVGYYGDWRRAGAVLFEQTSLSGDHKSGRERKERVADGVAGSLGTNNTGSGQRYDLDSMGAYLPMLYEHHPSDSRIKESPEVAQSLNARMGTGGNNVPLLGSFWDGGQICQTLDAVLHKGQTMPEKNRLPAVLVPADLRRTGGLNERELAPPITAECKQGDTDPLLIIPELTGPITANEQRTYTNEGKSGVKLRNVVTQRIHAVRTAQTGANGIGVSEDKAHTLDGSPGQAISAEMGDNQPAVRQGVRIRRLTPRECERLQGLPDDYTLIPYGKKGQPAKDGPRYKALGNSMAVPVMRWIMERIAIVDKI